MFQGSSRSVTSLLPLELLAADVNVVVGAGPRRHSLILQLLCAGGLLSACVRLAGQMASVEDDLFYLQAAQMLEDEWAQRAHNQKLKQQAHNQELKQEQDIAQVTETNSAANFQPSNPAAQSTETFQVTHPAIAAGCLPLDNSHSAMPPATQLLNAPLLNVPAKKRGRPAIKENAAPPPSANAADAAMKQKKPRSKAASASASLSEQPTVAPPPTVVVRVANAKNFVSASVLMPIQARVDSPVEVHASNCFPAASPAAIPSTSQLVNRAGVPVLPGRSWPDALYCGRVTGHGILSGAFTRKPHSM